MVCIYCAGPLGVINSRFQKQTNQTWRRRICKSCGAIFTTTERVDYDKSFMVADTAGSLTPLSRDKLLVSIFKSCQHRKRALQDATALTDTALTRLLKTAADKGVVERTRIIVVVAEILDRFDHAAAVQYAAYHPLPAA